MRLSMFAGITQVTQEQPVEVALTRFQDDPEGMQSMCTWGSANETVMLLTNTNSCMAASPVAKYWSTGSFKMSLKNSLACVYLSGQWRPCSWPVATVRRWLVLRCWPYVLALATENHLPPLLLGKDPGWAILGRGGCVYETFSTWVMRPSEVG